MQSSTSFITTYYQTAAGILQVLSTQQGIFQAQFVEKFDRNRYTLEPITNLVVTNLVLMGTPFQNQVWRAALEIPAGQTTTYQAIAHRIGKPKAYRAVANALAANKIAYIVPCHRVIRQKGDMSGYAWGVDRKQALLAAEKKLAL